MKNKIDTDIPNAFEIKNKRKNKPKYLVEKPFSSITINGRSL